MFNALGVTLFPAPHLEKNDPARLDGELSTLREAGVFDFARTFTDVAGSSWTDRMADAADVENVGRMAIRLFQSGVRAAHCIFADGNDFPRSMEERRKIIDDYAGMLEREADKFLLVEIVNERANGAKLSVGETRELARRLQSKTSVPVVASAPGSPEDYENLYSGSGLSLANMHGERDIDAEDGGRFEPLWKPYEFPWADGDPTACAWLEPIGPQSSGEDETDPFRLVLHYVTTHVLGCTAHVLHVGAGIRLGGSWDRNRGLPERLADTTHWKEIVDGLRSARAYLPPGVANWSGAGGHQDQCVIDFRRYRHPNPSAPGGLDNGPFDDFTLFKAYARTDGHRFFGVALRFRGDLRIALKQSGTLSVLDPLTGHELARKALSAGEDFTLVPSPERLQGQDNERGDAVILTGTFS